VKSYPLDPARLFDEAPCGLIATDETGQILHTNATFRLWLGYDAQELAGRRLQDLFTMGARIFHQTHWMPLLKLQGSVAEVKVEITHRDGTTLPLIINAIRHVDEGLEWHELAAFIAKDRGKYETELLAARKKAEHAQEGLVLAEARLRLALESGALYVWDIDPATRVAHYDDGVAILLGHDAPRPITAADMHAAMPAEDRDSEARVLAAALNVPADPLNYAIRLDGVDGVRRVVNVFGVGVFDANRRLARFVGVLQDVTEQASQQAAAEDRAQFAEQMVAIVSHDLRNPLSTIKMAAALLARDSLSDKQARLVSHIDVCADRAKRLIGDLLDFTQARVGKGIAVAPKPVDLHALVARGLAELQLAFQGNPLIHDAAGTGLCQADADRLTQLLGNLTANAVAYGTRDAPVRVRTEVAATSFSITVQNEGNPIPPVLLARIFQPMTRGEHLDEGARSVGLGLYIVQQIAQAHGGRVDVLSDLANGTTFTVTFPRHDGSAAQG
jgi:sigma-B regulation protein RsbU (phosphoserine phosphatase)